MRTNLHRIFTEVRHGERAANHAAVAMRIPAHSSAARRRQRAERGSYTAIFFEEFLRLVAAQPALQHCQVPRVLADIGNRHLMGAPETLHAVTVDLLRAGPALRTAQDHHGPARPFGTPGGARGGLDPADLRDAMLQRRRHRLVHAVDVGSFDEARRVAVAAEQRLQFVTRDARQNRWVVDLVAVQVQHRQHRAVAHRIKELVGMPGGCERPGLRLAIAHHDGGDQVRVVKCRAVGVRDGIAEFAAFMNRTGRLRRAVTADAAGKRETAEETRSPSSSSVISG